MSRNRGGNNHHARSGSGDSSGCASNTQPNQPIGRHTEAAVNMARRTGELMELGGTSQQQASRSIHRQQFSGGGPTPNTYDDMPPVDQRRTPAQVPETTQPSGSGTRSSTRTDNGPPPGMFMPRNLPALPRYDSSGRPMLVDCNVPQFVDPHEAYIYVSFNMPLSSARVANSLNSEQGEKSAGPKKRGPISGVRLEKQVKEHGRYKIETTQYGTAIAGQDSTHKYTSQMGSLIRDKVPFLWAEWSMVLQEVKDQLNVHLSGWFDIP